MIRNLLCGLSLFCALSSFGQSDVYLKISHKLGGSDFSYNVQATNDVGNDFKTTRLEYYIAEIAIIHDGGQITEVDSTWLLVDAGNYTNVMLGNFNISTLEGVRMSVGVEATVNHNDPTLWPTSHPLAPQWPSMHWGWLAGYRFVCMEGKSGTSFNQDFQIHALEDKNYHTLTINTAGVSSGSDITSELNGDYAQALSGIDVSSGLIEHSGSNEAASLLLNFAQKVFTSIEGNPSLSATEEELPEFEIFPNPCVGQFSIQMPGNSFGAMQSEIYNALGQVVLNGAVRSKDRIEVQGLDNGVYYVRLLNGSQSATKTIIVHH